MPPNEQWSNTAQQGLVSVLDSPPQDLEELVLSAPMEADHDDTEEFERMHDVPGLSQALLKLAAQSPDEHMPDDDDDL